MNHMSNNTKLEISVELIAARIAMYSKEGHKPEDEDMKKLIQERNEMYKGNEIIIDKIIRDYGTKN